jgi:metal-sulfur cluster biosynthetic enzyme
MTTQADIEEVLKNIPDPEIGVSLWDLGLVYEIRIDESTGIVRIVMTLTTIGCPLFSLIAKPIKQEIKKLDGVTEVEVELTFEPPWTTDKMTQKAREELGMM